MMHFLKKLMMFFKSRETLVMEDLSNLKSVAEHSISLLKTYIEAITDVDANLVGTEKDVSYMLYNYERNLKIWEETLALARGRDGRTIDIVSSKLQEAKVKVDFYTGRLDKVVSIRRKLTKYTVDVQEYISEISSSIDKIRADIYKVKTSDGYRDVCNRISDLRQYVYLDKVFEGDFQELISLSQEITGRQTSLKE